MIKVAVILTCHNRKDKTVTCLEHLFLVFDDYIKKSHNLIGLDVFLTDDGCTDGTVETVKDKFFDKSLTVVPGNGQLFWAGGMREAWKEALKNGHGYDYFLLLNDDTIIFENCFDELFKTNDYSLKKCNRKGVYSGITCFNDDPNKISYGGSIWTNRLLAKLRMLEPCGNPQLCDVANANILLVPREVVDEIGILYDGYRHAVADYDYSITARKKNIPVFVTANVCGKCNDDHGTLEENGRKICAMTLKDRIRYFDNPLHSNKDYLLFIRRNAPMRYPMVAFGRFLNVYFPKLYYQFIRG